MADETNDELVGLADEDEAGNWLEMGGTDADRDESPKTDAQSAWIPGDPCVRAENEDDDGYDPYSDRRPTREPLFSADPWD